MHQPRSTQSARNVALCCALFCARALTRALRPHAFRHMPPPGSSRQIIAAGFPARLHALQAATQADIQQIAARTSDSSAPAPPAPLQAKQAGEQAQGGRTQGAMEYAQCVLGGLLGSSCCLLQLGANALASLNVVHIGCAGFNKVLGPIRPQVCLLPNPA